VKNTKPQNLFNQGFAVYFMNNPRILGAIGIVLVSHNIIGKDDLILCFSDS